MSDKANSSLIKLPVELVYRILDNLDEPTIFLSCRNVCKHFNAIIDTYHRYQVFTELDLTDMTKKRIQLPEPDCMLYCNSIYTPMVLPTKIGTDVLQQIANILQNNTTLKISDCEVDDEGAEYIANGLKRNTALTKLNLFVNRIYEQGVKHLADALQINTTLTTLELGWNFISPQGAQYLACTLLYNRALTSLDLSSSGIGDAGVQHLANALQSNMVRQIITKSLKTLTILSIVMNHITHQGAEYLAKALQINTALTTLNLDYNGIGHTGTQFLANALKFNQTLETLGLQQNGIGILGAKFLADALQINKLSNIVCFATECMITSKL